jgi:hypothetical protein
MFANVVDINYADAYDGDDLEVHLMFEEYIEPKVEEEEEPGPITEDTPFISMPLTVLALLAVALRRQNQ